MNNDTTLRNQAIEAIRSLCQDKVIHSQDLRPFLTDEIDPYDPENVRREMESWYKTLGIEVVTGRKFTLSLPFFTRNEIAEAYENNEFFLCVPKGISRKELGILFNIDSWALEDELISKTTEVEDFWYKTPKTAVPEHLDKLGKKIHQIYKSNSKLTMSLERYLVFVARYRYLTGDTPDQNHKTWITHGRYEGTMMLIAGFDSSKKLAVHAWMPNFKSPEIGGRYVWIPDHLYL